MSSTRTARPASSCSGSCLALPLAPTHPYTFVLLAPSILLYSKQTARKGLFHLLAVASVLSPSASVVPEKSARDTFPAFLCGSRSSLSAWGTRGIGISLRVSPPVAGATALLLLLFVYLRQHTPLLPPLPLRGRVSIATQPPCATADKWTLGARRTEAGRARPGGASQGTGQDGATLSADIS